MNNGIHYQLLDAADWPQFEAIHRSQDWFVPDPAFCIVAVAKAGEGRVVASLPLQLHLHAEPAFVAPEYRGKVDLLKLVEVLKANMNEIVSAQSMVGRGFMVVATHPAIEKVAQEAGMRPIEGRIFVGEL